MEALRRRIGQQANVHRGRPRRPAPFVRAGSASREINAADRNGGRFFLAYYVRNCAQWTYIAGKTKKMSKDKTTQTTQKPVKQRYIHVRIKTPTHRALKTYAAQKGISMSEAIEHLIFLAAKM